MCKEEVDEFMKTLQDGIMPPWQPESHKPVLPFVICTTGEGVYWIGHYMDARGIAQYWEFCTPDGWVSDPYYKPLAWIEPEKFVPFVKAREIHFCGRRPGLIVGEDEEGLFMDKPEWKEAIKIQYCPLCGYKTGEK